MEYITLIFKTIFLYILVAFIFRILGKREVGQLGTFDLVVFILIADLVAMAIEHKKFIYYVIPIVLLILLEIIVAKLSLKNEKFRNLVDGKPTFIIKDGIINFSNMVNQRYTLDDLLLQLRQKNIKSIEEVDYAILETNGRLSVFKKEFDKSLYPMPIILDGKVQFDSLIAIKKSKRWLLNILLNKNIKINDIFYAFCKNKELYIIKKSDTK